MATILILTHGPLGQALLDTCEMILGDVGDVAALSFQPGEGPEDLTAKLEAIAVDAEGLLCLTDLQGGTPARVAASLSQTSHLAVVCGVNLPMVLEVLGAGQAQLEDLTALAVSAGRDSILDLGGMLRRYLDNTPIQKGAVQ